MTRLLYAAVATVALLAVAAALAAGAFLRGLDLDGEFLRARLERVLTAAFDVPTRIEGPLRLRTGRSATLAADALVLADPTGPAGATLARGTSPRARIDLAALLRGTVLLEEVGGERLELQLHRRADGRGNWSQLFSVPGGSSPVSFAGIERLRIDKVAGSYHGQGRPAVPFAITAFDGAVPRQQPLRGAGRAEIGGQQVDFALRTASLDGLASAAGVPLRGSLSWQGTTARIDGTLHDGGARLEASVEVASADATALLAAIGVAANEPGALSLRGRLSLADGRAAATDLALSLGRSSASGTASVTWGGPTPSIAADLRGDLLDAGPFLDGAATPAGTAALDGIVARLDRLASAAGLSLTLAAGRFDGLPVGVGGLRLDLRGGEGALAAKLAAELAGTRVDASLDYDARRPQRTLEARIDSAAVSSSSLPGSTRPADLALAAGSIRGRLSGSGDSARAIVASLRGELDARNLHWTFSGREPPLAGRFDKARLALQRWATTAELSGTIAGAACRLSASGGAAAPLLAGEPWPLRFSATCPNERLSASGRIALGGTQPTADLSFDIAADRPGAVAGVAGLPSIVPFPVAARGTLLLDAERARLRLAEVRSGRSRGSGEISLPRSGSGTPSLRLALESLSLDDFAAKRPAGDAAAGPLERRLLHGDLPLPEADFELTARRIDYGRVQAGEFRLAGALRARRVQAAAVALRWEGIDLRGRAGLDLSGDHPRLDVEAAAQDADLRPLLDRLGVQGLSARAARLSVAANAQGERLRELLASASLEAALDRVQFEIKQPLLPGSTGRGSADATFRASPGQRSRLTMRGLADGRPVEVAIDGPAVDALATDGRALPLALRASIGDIRLEADGRISRGGAIDARVRLAGDQLDKLGHLVGVTLPPAAPFSASAAAALSAEAFELSGLEASFGSSRISGRARVDRRDGRRVLYSATLRAPVLHLEDIGAGRWLGGRIATGPAPVGAEPGPLREALERLLALLPRADVKASIEIDSLIGGGQRFASGRIVATADDGVLHARLLDVRAQEGTSNAELLIDAAAATPRLRLRADIRDVEYGALARAANPGSQLSGTVDVATELSAQGPPGRLLQALQGTIDFAAYPRDMRPDALGLWGAGLLPAILRAVERDARAQVLCSVIGFAVADGVARSDGFFVETTSVRIVGDLEVRLGTWELAGRIDPRSTTPRLFEIAPRMQIGGALGSPSLTVAPESLVLAPLRFASPLTLFSRDWLRGGRRSAGGKADCREAFDRVLEVHHGQAAPR